MLPSWYTAPLGVRLLEKKRQVCKLIDKLINSMRVCWVGIETTGNSEASDRYVGTIMSSIFTV